MGPPDGEFLMEVRTGFVHQVLETKKIMRRKMAECLVDLVTYRIDVPKPFSGYKSVCFNKYI
jgi:hypothetical protein